MIKMTLVLMALAMSSAVMAQSGGDFTITRSVIGGGGGSATGDQFSLSGTVGQPLVDRSTGGGFRVASGFWSRDQLIPTSAAVAISGRVTTANGAGIRNVQVTLISASGARRTLSSGAFGHYQFNDVLVGETYILSINSVRFVFANPSMVVHVLDELTDLNFVAEPQ